MENTHKLQRRSDDVCETSSGFFAVSPRYVSGSYDETSWFEFKASVMADAVRIEWVKGADVILLPQDIANAMLRAKYAANISDEQMEAWNNAVAAAEASVAAAGASVAASAPALAATAPLAPKTPVAPVKTLAQEAEEAAAAAKNKD